ncbi:unnamed protein product, partial [Nesidiocoris tenuis]
MLKFLLLRTMHVIYLVHCRRILRNRESCILPVIVVGLSELWPLQLRFGQRLFTTLRLPQWEMQMQEVGCVACSCYAAGSLSTRCDINTGQCDCKPGVIGLQCDQCPNAYAQVTHHGCE